MRPEFSPEMLRFFLRARVSHAGMIVVPPGAATPDGQRRPKARGPAERRMKKRLRKTAGVSNTVFEMAWMARLLGADERARLWGALGLVPADFGVCLTRGGQEDIIGRAEQ